MNVSARPSEKSVPRLPLARLGGMDPGQLPKTVATMGISSRPGGFMALMSSHPPIEDRIRALQQG